MWISCAWALVLSFSQAYKRAHSAPSFALPYYLQVNAIRTAICQTIDSIFKWQQILARACSWHGTTKQHTACDSNSNSDSDGDGDLRESPDRSRFIGLRNTRVDEPFWLIASKHNVQRNIMTTDNLHCIALRSNLRPFVAEPLCIHSPSPQSCSGSGLTEGFYNVTECILRTRTCNQRLNAVSAFPRIFSQQSTLC